MWICTREYTAVNTHSMAEIFQDGNNLYYTRMGDTSDTLYALARYETEKRAQEVFISLMNELAEGRRVFVMPDSDYKELIIKR